MKIWSVGASVSGFEISYRLTREVWIKKIEPLQEITGDALMGG